MHCDPSLEQVLRKFNLTADTAPLPGGTTGTIRAGRAVLKHIHETSLENNHSQELVQWIAGFSAYLPQEGFRLPMPLATTDGGWITDDGWTAWSFLEGRHATRQDIPECIPAINALHAALKVIP